MAAADILVGAPSGDTSGVTDRLMIQATLDKARLAGGGVVTLQTGTYIVNAVAHPTNPAAFTGGLFIGGNTKLRGVDRQSTVVRFAPNQPNSTAAVQVGVIQNYFAGGVGGNDENLSFEDFTVDGNAANQNAVNGQFGIDIISSRGVSFFRMRVINVRGTASFGVQETFFYDIELSSDIVMTDCYAVSNAGTSATGFAMSGCSNAEIKGCVAVGLSTGQGFVAVQSRNINYGICQAYQCGNFGFDVENCDFVTYDGCISGGQAGGFTSPVVPSYPFVANQNLGNGVHGFANLGSTRVKYSACESRGNAGSGWYFAQLNNGVVLVTPSSILVNCGAYANAAWGYQYNEAVDVASNSIGASCDSAGNTTGDAGGAGLTTTAITGILAAPAVPATTVVTNNPFPFDCMVVATAPAANPLTIARDGTTYRTLAAAASGGFRLRKGGTYTYTYAAGAPSHVWDAAL